MIGGLWRAAGTSFGDFQRRLLSPNRVRQFDFKEVPLLLEKETLTAEEFVTVAKQPVPASPIAN